MDTKKVLQLLSEPVQVIHLGVEGLATGMEATGGLAALAEFVPPADGDKARIDMLLLLSEPALAARISAANELALSRCLAAQPMLVGIGLARDMIPSMEDNLFLHAGPPVTWDRMSGPLQGAVIGGILLENMATNADEAKKLAASGRIRFAPCHHHQAVGPMAGLITSNMPVWIVEDVANSGRRTFCTINEGLGKVLRYGAFSEEVIHRLRYMADSLAPILKAALEHRGPIDLKMLFAQALQMGDEGHNRNRAGTSLLFRELAPAMAAAWPNGTQVEEALSFIHRNDHFFLNISMPMAKSMLMAAEGIKDSSMVTIMARNGTDFGIQVASMPNRWFTAPSPHVKGLYFPGYSSQDANPDIGDSAITETAGFGGFAMAAAPAIVQFVGGNVFDALQFSRQMRQITLGVNPLFSIPSLDFSGSATGIDVIKVIEGGVLPIINTGIAHKNAGVGQIGAGLTWPPKACFLEAFDAFVQTLS